MFHRLYRLPLVIVRAFMTYGPGQHPTKLVPYTTLALLRGETPHIVSGDWRADWIFVDDAIEGIMAAAKAQDIEGRELDLGTGRLTSVHEVVEMVRRLVGGESRIEFDPDRDRPDQIVRVADVEATRTALGWSATTPLTEGLERTVAWYREKATVGRSADTALL
jgi:UDP-glucose 4-epimerase